MLSKMPLMDKSVRKRKPSNSAASNSKRRRQDAPVPVTSVSSPYKPHPKLSAHRPTSSPRTVAEKPKEKKKKVKAVEQLTLFSRYADPLVQSSKKFYQVSEVAHVSEFNPTGATLLETPPSRQQTEPIAIPLTSNGGADGAIDLTGVKHVGDLEMVEGDGILETLMRSTTPRVQRRFPSEEALTDSEQRDREVLRRRRLKLRSQYSSMKKPSQEVRGGDCNIVQSPQIEKDRFQPVKREEPKVVARNEVTEEDEERAQLEEEEAETDEETTESKIKRLSKVMHMNWRQFFLWLVSGAFLLCAIVVTAPFVKKLLEPPLPYCDSEWIEVNDGSFVLADPADPFDRSKALQPFIATTDLADRVSRPACQPCPVYGNCLNGSVISCTPPYLLQYGLCKENPEVQENLDRLALNIQKFVVEKAAHKACDNVSLWSYLNSDGAMKSTNDLTASIEVLLSDVQAFVTRTISFGKAVSVLPREYVFNRALDMALRGLNDIFVTADQRQLIVGGGVVQWSCRAKHQLYSHIKLIALAVALGTVLVFGYRRFLLYRTERQLVDRFVKEARFFLLDRTRRSDRFYPADHLRDNLFEKQSLQDRAWLCKSVWPKVAAVVKDDSRIRARVMKVRNEDMVVWEWASSSSPSHRRAGGNRGGGFRAPSRPHQVVVGNARPARRRKNTTK